MANKRMFTMKIVDSDAFLDMPLSTQCLYFHLNMRADDDGFIDNVKRIMRLVGASEDDLKILIAKRFLLTFDDGVIVIKHWRMHNTLSSGRYHETQYLDEKSMLKLKDNGSYTLNDGKTIDDTKYIAMFSERRTSGEQVENADKDLDKELELDLDKDIDKELKEKDLSNDKSQKKASDISDVVDLFEEICVSFPMIRKVGSSRVTAIRARLKEYSLEDIEEVFRKAEESDFLCGRNSDFKASFDWLMKSANFIKVLEGNYDNRSPHNQTERNLGGHTASEWANA